MKPTASQTRTRLVSALVLAAAVGTATAFDAEREDKFRQLEEILPTANAYRTASGAPGHAYWQQKVDYVIDVRLDDENQRIEGSERITYHNNSPDTLTYLWVQIDPNIFAPESHAVGIQTAPDMESQSYRRLAGLLARREFDGGAEITAVLGADGAPLAHTINDTMMRVDLPGPLASGEHFELSIDWNYAINDSSLIRGRTGYEFFEDDGNYLYEIAQWFPRLAAYTDENGWQNKQFLGSGEFTLEFGDYLVRITAPDDHVVASTGVLQNPEEVLSPTQRARLAQAETTDVPIFIVTPEEAEANESSSPSGEKTWVFAAENVRDFAFASSRKFIWDAILRPVEGTDPVWCMSYWPKEGEPLWSRYSTHSIMHTLDVYSRHTFPYPYPVAISVNGPVGGMEYPMICFNGPRPEEDGTYSARTKYGLITVIIHEVGHNYFPMIVNSDERQWTWMDEGLNTFLQYIAEQEWEENYPSRRGEPKDIVGYMTSANQVPIMTNSESILQFGANAYGKPATALNILRETVMGRELFDFAFKEYANRWRFKRPQPADLFRTLEDASAVDLDWFWRGWFYSTDHTDISIENLALYTIDTRDPGHREGPRPRRARRRAGDRLGSPLPADREVHRALPRAGRLLQHLRRAGRHRGGPSVLRQAAREARRRRARAALDAAQLLRRRPAQQGRTGHARRARGHLRGRQRRGAPLPGRALAQERRHGLQADRQREAHRLDHARPAPGDRRRRPLEQPLAARGRGDPHPARRAPGATQPDAGSTRRRGTRGIGRRGLSAGFKFAPDAC